MHLGSTEIAKAFLGTNLVFQKGGVTPYSRLPQGFTELAYVGTDSSAWLDTGVAGATDLEITARFSVSNFIQFGAIYGNRIDGDHNCCRAVLYSNNQLAVDGGNGSNGNWIYDFFLNQVHTLRVDTTTAYLESTSTNISASPLSGNTNNICLGSNSVINPNTSRNIGLRIFAFIIKKSGVVILNLVPAMRDNDSAVGFYDLVNDAFLKSETGVAFMAGPVAKYSDGMLLALHWDGSDNPSSSRWYDRIGNQYFTLTNGTHGDGYFEFLNPNAASAVAYARLNGTLPDLGYHWKIVIDAEVKINQSVLSTKVPFDFGAYGEVSSNKCGADVSLSASQSKWIGVFKLNGNDSSSTYGTDSSSMPVEPELSGAEKWIRRTITIGVRASSVTGKDESFIIVKNIGTSVSATPFTPIRCNRWFAGTSYLSRSMVTPSNDYKYATNTRIHSIKVYYETE